MTRSIQLGSRKGLSALAVSTLLVAVSFSLALANSSSHTSYDYDDSYQLSYNYENYGYNRNQYNSTYAYNDYFDRYTNYHSNQYAQPACSIEVTRYNGSYGYDRTVTITWTSSYATSAYLSGVGSVGVNGAQAMYYPFNPNYTLTVYGPGGSSSCTTYTQNYTYQNHDYVRPSPYLNSNYTYPVTYITPTYTNPTVYTSIAQTYVPLNKIPYTGFDYGMLGNALYWLGIILVAGAGANFIVYQHTHRMPAAFVKEVVQAARNQIRTIRTLVK